MASDSCCNAGRPLKYEYKPIGADTTADGTDIYITGSGTLGVVLVTDIFGIAYPQVSMMNLCTSAPKDITTEALQVKQVADRIAAAGFSVAVPDMFLGQPWELERMPVRLF